MKFYYVERVSVLINFTAIFYMFYYGPWNGGVLSEAQSDNQKRSQTGWTLCDHLEQCKKLIFPSVRVRFFVHTTIKANNPQYEQIGELISNTLCASPSILVEHHLYIHQRTAISVYTHDGPSGAHFSRKWTAILTLLPVGWKEGCRPFLYVHPSTIEGVDECG